MPAPLEIIAGAADVWVAPALTADVALNAAPGGAWVKLGTAGSKDYTEDGVTLHMSQDVNEIFGLGATGPRKAFRNREGFHVTLTLMDVTLEMWAHAWNEAAITTLVGPPAEKTINLVQGGAVNTRAVLIRSAISPYADSANPTQLWIPLAYQKANVEARFKKADAMGLPLDFVALQDDTNGFGKLHMPTS